MKKISSDLLKQNGSSLAIFDKDGLVRQAPPSVKKPDYNIVLRSSEQSYNSLTRVTVRK
jgi:hypothetical protein